MRRCMSHTAETWVFIDAQCVAPYGSDGRLLGPLYVPASPSAGHASASASAVGGGGRAGSPPRRGTHSVAQRLRYGGGFQPGGPQVPSSGYGGGPCLRREEENFAETKKECAETAFPSPSSLESDRSIALQTNQTFVDLVLIDDVAFSFGVSGFISPLP